METVKEKKARKAVTIHIVSKHCSVIKIELLSNFKRTVYSTIHII